MIDHDFLAVISVDIHGSEQSGLVNKKRPVRGVFACLLAETEGFEPSMRLYTPYSLSRGAPSATRSRFQQVHIMHQLMLQADPSRKLYATRAQRVPCISRRSPPMS